MWPSVTVWLSDVFMDSDGARTETCSLLFLVFLQIIMTIRKIYIFCLNMLAPQGLFFSGFFQAHITFWKQFHACFQKFGLCGHITTCRPFTACPNQQTNQSRATAASCSASSKMEIKNRFWRITQRDSCLYLDIFWQHFSIDEPWKTRTKEDGKYPLIWWAQRETMYGDVQRSRNAGNEQKLKFAWNLSLHSIVDQTIDHKRESAA